MPYLRLIRTQYEPCTLGRLQLFIEGKGATHLCYTLEPSRSLLLHPCIPVGNYNLKVTYSPKFRCNLPLLLDVKGRDGILIHSGNTCDDTLGCILTGVYLQGLVLKHSKVSFRYLMDIIKVFDIKRIEILDYGTV